MTGSRSATEAPYVRDSDYPRRYRDERFDSGTGRRTHAREVRALRRLLARAPAVEGPWLDVPCGAGRLSELLPGPVVQVDRSYEMVAAVPAGRRRVCASALALPFEDQAFAGALCMRLLHHLPEREQRIAVLRELRRVTRGPVLVSFFHAGSLQHARRALKRRAGGARSGRCAISIREFLCELDEADLRMQHAWPLAPLISEQWIVLAGPRQ